VKKAESFGKIEVGTAKIEHLLNKSKIIVETLGNFLQISTSKNNTCHEHYYRGSSPYANFITARYLWLMRFLTNFISLMHFFCYFWPKKCSNAIISQRELKLDGAIGDFADPL